MSCAVMYTPYPSSPYLLPSGPPGPVSTPNHHHHQLPVPSFDRHAHTPVSSAIAGSPVNHHSPQSPQNQQRLLGHNLPNSTVEPKLEKNLDAVAATNVCDAYGQLLAASSRASENAGPPPSTPPSATSRPGSSVCGQRRDSEANPEGKEEASEKSGNAQYLASNRVLITNYDRDAQSAVEEHFNRALSYANSEAPEKAPTPMSQRGLPASFWQLPQPNLNGHHNPLGTPVSSSAAAASYADLYSDQLQQAAALHQLAAEWQYPSAAHSAQTSYASRSAAAAAAHPYNYSRFHQPSSAAAGSYWASRLAAGQVKGEWAPSDYQAAAAAAALQGASGLHNAAGDFSHHYGAAAAHHYSNMTGLESSMQDSGKELYWPTSF